MRSIWITLGGLAAITLATVGLTSDVEASHERFGCSAPAGCSAAAGCAGERIVLFRGRQRRQARRQARRADRAAGYAACAAPVGCGGY